MKFHSFQNGPSLIPTSGLKLRPRPGVSSEGDEAVAAVEHAAISRVSDLSELEGAHLADQVLILELLVSIVEHLGERRPGLHINPLKLRGTLILAEFDPQDLETSEAGKRQLSLALKRA